MQFSFQAASPETFGYIVVQLHAFLTSALDGGKWSALHPGRFTPALRAPGTRWIRGWVGSRTVLEYAHFSSGRLYEKEGREAEFGCVGILFTAT
jgi:hypothetical protein